MTHADTVFEKDSGFLEFKLNEKQNTATGPGVIDDKGGIVVALLGLEKFLEKKQKLNLRFICTPSEEIGSPGFHSLLKQLGSESKMVLGFEPSMDDGNIIHSRRGNRWYHVCVEGKHAHAGRDYKKGVNAGFELAYKLSEMHKLTDYAKDLTVSLGQMQGGTKFNIVCGHAEAKLDIRFSDFKTRDEIHQQMEKIINKSHIGKNEEGLEPKPSFTIVDDCPPIAVNSTSQEFIQKYCEIVGKIEGKAPNAVKSGGAADANYMSHPSLIVMDGLGATGGGMHRLDEFIKLSSLDTRSRALTEFLNYIAER